MKLNSHRAAAGFTMFELVMVMSIVGIIAAIGLPSFRYVTASNRISSEINGMLSDLRFARSEAVKQGLPVTVCISTDGTSCSTGGTDWSVGWIVFSDPGSTRALAAGQVSIKYQIALTKDFGGNDTFIAANGMTYITFNREGFGSSNAVPATSTETISLKSTPANQNWTRCLFVTPIGALSISKAPNLSCQ
jgi:type IV fimbrial biogenesis protein FimT